VIFQPFPIFFPLSPPLDLLEMTHLFPPPFFDALSFFRFSFHLRHPKGQELLFLPPQIIVKSTVRPQRRFFPPLIPPVSHIFFPFRNAPPRNFPPDSFDDTRQYFLPIPLMVPVPEIFPRCLLFYGEYCGPLFTNPILKISGFSSTLPFFNPSFPLFYSL